MITMLGIVAAGLFVAFAALMVVLFVPSPERRDARRRNQAHVLADAIAIARRYADGEATEDERSAAVRSAWSAAAESAAESAAWSAAARSAARHRLASIVEEGL